MMSYPLPGGLEALDEYESHGCQEDDDAGYPSQDEHPLRMPDWRTLLSALVDAAIRTANDAKCKTTACREPAPPRKTAFPDGPPPAATSPPLPPSPEPGAD